MTEAAPVVATPAAAVPPPPVPTEVAESSAEAEFGEADPIFAALATHKPEEETVEVEGEPAKDAKPDTEKDKSKDLEKPGAKKKRQDLEAELLSETALKTPEGVTKARDYLRTRQAKLDGLGQRHAETHKQLEERASAIETAYRAAQAELEPQREYAKNLVQLRSRLNNPENIEEFINALGAVAGRPGIEVWENGARFMVNGGKRPPVSREVEELRSHVTKLERALVEREERNEARGIEQEEAHQRAFVEKRSAEIVTAAKDAEKYPELAKSAVLGLGENIVAEVAKMKRSAKNRGQRLGDSEALAIIEGELKKLTASGARVPASPAAASAADAPRTSSIAPSQTRSAGSLRDKSDAELAEDLAKDTAALSFILGTPVG